MTGTLYVVSTPIGNLGDITARAREILSTVSVIACEDTRQTRKLLQHLGIHTKTISYHEHNENQRTETLLERLRLGNDIALVSDAGTPLVSDPGYILVNRARQESVEIRAIPGASALLAGLTVSGLPTSSFTFVGFLPPRGAARRKSITDSLRMSGTIVFFEAPTRIARLLKELSSTDGERPACLLREMTKLHEEHRTGSLNELAVWSNERTFKGELTLVVGSSPKKTTRISIKKLAPSFTKLRADGLSSREASKKLAKEHGFSARDVYNAFSK